MKSRYSVLMTLIFVSMGILVLVLLTVSIAGNFKVTEYDSVIVTDKERVTTGQGSDQSSRYMVFTDKGSFEVTDSFVMWRFDSSDVYGRIREGECYDVSVRGYRIPFLSVYQNIDTIETCIP